MFALAGGDRRYCRVDNEIRILQDAGCYADFTFPDMETPAQPRRVNSIYYARSNGRSKDRDQGPEAAVGNKGSGLLMVPGPMCLGFCPKVLDDGQVEPNYLPHPSRIDRWLDAHVHVRGRPNWVFVAVHSHTAIEAGQRAVFSGPMQALWHAFEHRFKKENARLHYVTTREAYNIIRAAEAGRDGNPADYRDFEIPPPANRRNAVPNSAAGTAHG
jgi:hypothetical protein